MKPYAKLLAGLLAIGQIAITSTYVAHSQAVSVNGGSIQGTITDPSGAVVPNATVTISSKSTGTSKTIQTDSAGLYAFGPANPGDYDISISATGFQNLQVSTVIRTGTVTPGSFHLTLGASSQTVEVQAGEIQVNTDQAGVSDVITSAQIKTLPVNGRNFLDLAQIEPGVILQSGESFDPTKAGYSAISVSGVSGRTTRILLDGQDITDETVGTTIFNVSSGAINEFQLNRSTQDVSGEVTSTGQVLVSTNTGTNSAHGQLFYQFQDHGVGFARTQGGLDAPFQRNQFGGSVGFPILKDKLFFFANSERIKQDSSSSASVGTLFSAIQAQYPAIPSPYRETYSTGRLDYNGPHGVHYFARLSYNVNSVASNYNYGYWLYANRDNTPGYAFGSDFTTGRFTHSIRGSYEKFHNLIGDLTAGNSGIYNGIPGFTFYDTAQRLYSGPNYLAPQGTFQSDKQFRYDGTWTKGAHNIRYGYSLNRILGGGFANFFGLSPRTSISASTLFGGPTADDPNALGCGAVAGAAPCANDPLNGYHPNSVIIANGQGYFTEKNGFGLPGGGVEDWRQGAYIGDNWKVTPRFTLTAGVRWSVDTDRANQDLATPSCSEVAGDIAPCTGAAPLLDQFQAGLGKKIHQPWANFGPQLGFAFSLNDKTVIRAGAGIFYEGDVFNNTTNARTNLIKSGLFFNDYGICASGPNVPLPDGTVLNSIDGLSFSQVCALPLAQAAPHIINIQNTFESVTNQVGAQSNGAYVANTLQINGAYAAPYRTPYSEQWNGGIQRELWKGAVVSVDYVHNSTLKVSQTVDVNHVGAARTFRADAAQNAITQTLAKLGVTTIDEAIAAGAQITDFANTDPDAGPIYGLDSGNVIYNGLPASVNGATPATGAAFPGVNPAVGNGLFLLPVGRSGYDALQTVYRQQKSHPFGGVDAANFQVAYSLSRIVSTSNNTSGDQFFSNDSFDYDSPTRYIGRASLDHTHQVTFGGSFDFKYGPRFAVIGHFFSPTPTTLSLDTAGNNAGNIFQTDVTGDGTIGDLVPGTDPGYYMHQVNGKNLNRFIDGYNNTQAGTLTPAGRALVTAGLFSEAQLAQLGAVQQRIAQLPQGTALQNAVVKAFDASFSYPIKLTRWHEGLSIEPVVAFYNVGNLANFNSYTGVLANVNTAGGAIAGDETAGTLNGPNNFQVHDSNRVQRGSGTFDAGGPRSTEFQLKINF